MRRMNDLRNVTVLVTGATSGFGQACAEAFVRQGARVVAVGRRADRLGALAAKLGDRVHPLELDLRDREQTEAALGKLPFPFAQVDVFVNNAGLALGLAIVKKIVLQHGGEIEAGERPGGGASFTIALPLRDVPAA